MLGIVLLFAGVQSQTFSHVDLQNSPLLPFSASPFVLADHSPMKISALSQLEAFDFINGTGTQEDPFIIQEIQIDAQRVGTAFELLNLQAYIEIRNCTFLNSNLDPINLFNFNFSKFNILSPEFELHYDAGLRIVNCSNLSITTCEFRGNYAGIYVSHSTNVSITNCSSTYNEYGIRIYESTKVNISSNSLAFNQVGLAIRNGHNVEYNDNLFAENQVENLQISTINNQSVWLSSLYILLLFTILVIFSVIIRKHKNQLNRVQRSLLVAGNILQFVLNLALMAFEWKITFRIYHFVFPALAILFFKQHDQKMRRLKQFKGRTGQIDPRDFHNRSSENATIQNYEKIKPIKTQDFDEFNLAHRTETPKAEKAANLDDAEVEFKISSDSSGRAKKREKRDKKKAEKKLEPKEDADMLEIPNLLDISPEVYAKLEEELYNQFSPYRGSAKNSQKTEIDESSKRLYQLYMENQKEFATLFDDNPSQDDTLNKAQLVEDIRLYHKILIIYEQIPEIVSLLLDALKVPPDLSLLQRKCSFFQNIEAEGVKSKLMLNYWFIAWDPEIQSILPWILSKNSSLIIIGKTEAILQNIHTFFEGENTKIPNPIKIPLENIATINCGATSLENRESPKEQITSIISSIPPVSQLKEKMGENALLLGSWIENYFPLPALFTIQEKTTFFRIIRDKFQDLVSSEIPWLTPENVDRVIRQISVQNHFLFIENTYVVHHSERFCEILLEFQSLGYLKDPEFKAIKKFWAQLDWPTDELTLFLQILTSLHT